MANEPKLSGELIKAAREGRLALFLGAGASRGALASNGKESPDGQQLADQIAETFLLPKHKGLDLKVVYDLACSRRSVRELQKFLHDTFIDLEPTPAHLLIPDIPWLGIATTNYDLLVERAYATRGRLDNLVVTSHDGAHALDAIPREKTIYLKLHGCISEYENVEHPLITSTEQMIDHENGRSNIFKTLLEWGQNNSIAIVGYGMNDENLRSLFYQLIKERDNRPRHYIVRPGWDEVTYDYWKDRRFDGVESDMSAFMTALTTAMPSGSMQLGHLAKASRATTLSPFIAHANVQESEHLRDALGATFDHVTGETTAAGSAQAFYAGVNQGWYPIEAKLDADRAITSHIVRRCILRPPEGGPQFFLIKGHAGSGKSVILRRLAWEAAKTYERLVLFLRSGQQIDIKALAEINALTNMPIYLFVDDAGEHLDEIRHLLERAGVQSWRLMVIGAERVNEWNVIEADTNLIPDGDFTIDYLNGREIEDLVLLLEEHQSLGELEKLTVKERIEAFREKAGRQLLVALHEATRGASFEDILESEYDGIPSLEAKALYLDICALHRFGPPVRAGLISRVHGISFAEFQKRFFRPLESVVMVTEDQYTGDYNYQSRHNYIAETVFYRATKSPQQRQELLLRIIDKINTEYSYDELVLYEVVKSRNLVDLFADRRMGETIFQAAERSVGRTPRLLHQWALYELRLSRDRGGLDRAEGLVQEALRMSPESSALRHTLAELALKRADLARTDLEAVALRQQAAAIARRLTSKSPSSHAFHTLAKVAILNLDQALREEANEATELATQAVNHAIQEAEDAIRTGLHRFPNDPYLLESESQLAGKLKNAERALAALQRAFAQNARSELIANRLALMLEAREDVPGALQVLKKALDANPGSPILNLRYALALMRSEPGVDIEKPQIVLHYLKRSMRRGEANIESQFWYGRQLYLAGAETEAKAIFDGISRLKMPSELRNMERAIVQNPDGSPRIFYGEVSYLEALFGFITQAAPTMSVYFRRAGPLLDGKAVSLHQRVRYQLHFNARGPVAVDIQPT